MAETPYDGERIVCIRKWDPVLRQTVFEPMLVSAGAPADAPREETTDTPPYAPLPGAAAPEGDDDKFILYPREIIENYAAEVAGLRARLIAAETARDDARASRDVEWARAKRARAQLAAAETEIQRLRDDAARSDASIKRRAP